MPDSLHNKANNSDAPPGSTPLPLSGVEVTDDQSDISWDLWNKAIAGIGTNDPNVAVDTQPLSLDSEVATEPMSLDDKSPERRKTDALALIGQHHPKVVAAIQATWGFKECAAYLNKLVLNGSDDSGHSRLGFSPQVIEALMGLTQLHEVQFGQLDKPEELGFGDYSVRAGLDGAR
jgi:hypothetical protein